jgi:hypothetical protein
MIGSAASVMVPNGGSGSISNTTLRPFVTGWIPVVGQQIRPPLRLPPAWQSRSVDLSRSSAKRKEPRLSKQTDDAPLRISPRQPATNSTITTATHGAQSVAEIRSNQRLQDQERLQEVAELVERARGAEQAGKLGVARIYYQQAANRSTGELKALLLEREQELKRRKASLQKPVALPVDSAGSNP